MSAYLWTVRLREEGWHGEAFDLGQGFIEEGELPSEAAEICGMNQYNYDYEALWRIIEPGNSTMHADGTITVESATLQRIGKSKLAVNLPNGERRVIDRVVDWYDPLQPADMVRILDPLAAQMQLEGLGILGKDAEIMFVQFELPPYAIGGDEHQAFLLFGDDKRQGGLYQATTHVRVVCNNTWTAAISELPSFGHSDAAFTMETVSRVYAASLRAQESEAELLNALFRRDFDKEERNEYAETVFPNPPKPAKVELAEAAAESLSEQESATVQERYQDRVSAYESGLDLARARRTHLMDEVSRFNNQMPEAANTGYALFNGLTAMARPDVDVRDAEGRKIFSGDNVNRLANSLFGRGTNGLAVARGRSWLANVVRN